MSGYKNKSISALEKILLSSPSFTRMQYADRLEQLILSIEEDSVFSWEYIHFKITGFRTDRGLEAAIPGSELIADLIMLLENLSGHSPMRTEEAPEEVLSPARAAERLNVSQRTVYRWRYRGLPARMYIFPDGRKHTGIRISSVEAFERKNPHLIATSSGFTRISAEEREKLLSMLHRTIKTRGCSPTEAAKLVADRTGRAPESLRLLLQSSPDDMRPRSHLCATDKSEIFRSIQAGVPVAQLAEKFNKSTQTIYRTYNAVRAGKLLQQIPDPGNIILPEDQTVEEKPIAVDSILKPGKDMKDFFLSLNLVKQQISLLRKSLQPKRYVRAAALDELEELDAIVKTMEMALLKKHLMLIIDTAKYHAGRGVALPELLRAGVESFFDSIKSFDYLANHTFSEFCRLRFLKMYARLIPGKEASVTGPALPALAEQSEAYSVLESMLMSMSRFVTPESADLIKRHFGMDTEPNPAFMREVAARLAARSV